MDDSGWTVDTLREFLQRQLDDQRVLLDERYATQTKALDAAFVAAEKALDKALTALNKRLDLLNELRGAVATIAQLEALASVVDDLKEQHSKEVASLKELLGSEVANLKEQLHAGLSAEKSRIDRTEGRSSGLNAGWVYLLAAIGAMGTIFTVYVILNGG